MLQRLHDSDRTAFDEIVRIHDARLRAVAHRVVGCPDTAAEVVQDVFFRLWRDRDTIEIRDHLGGYLAKAVRNRALDRQKRLRLEYRWLEREVVETEHAEVERISGSLSDSGSLDRGSQLMQALDQLPERRREIMLLRWREGLSYAEIASRLGLSAKTVENQIGRGLKTLRAILGPIRPD